MTSLWRIARIGLVAAVAVGLGGWALERWRFGGGDDAALERVRNELRDRLDATADAVGVIASRVAGSADALLAAPRDPAATRALFQQAEAALQDQDLGRAGVTLYGADGAPVAWAGRVFDLPKERLAASTPSLFVAPSALGPGLVRVEPISAANGSATVRAGTIVAELSLGTLRGAPGLRDTFVISTTLVPVELRARVGGAASSTGPFTFVVPNKSGGLLVEAEVSPATLTAARARWRRLTIAAVVAVAGATLLLCAGPMLDRRRRRPDARGFIEDTLALTAFLIVGLALVSFATRALTESPAMTSPPGVLIIALGALGLVSLVLDLVARWRTSRPRLALAGPGPAPRVLLLYFASGAASAAILAAYEGLLQRLIASTSIDVLHFSLHPLGAARIAVTFALILLHASAIWASVAVARAAGCLARTRRGWRSTASAAAAWIGGAVLTTIVAGPVRMPAPLPPVFVALAAVGACATALARVGGRLRRASQAARLFVFLLALLAPSLAMYPSLFAFAIAAKERLVAASYGPQVASQREDLQRQLQEAVEQIENLPLAEFVASADSTPTTDRAFVVWSRTDLATYRLTSSVELYDADGALISRFGNLPEYTTTPAHASSCTWEPLIDEVSPFGSAQRNVLRTSRGICEGDRLVGTIVVRVMLDYRALPFMASDSPYLDSLQSRHPRSEEGVSGRDVEFAVYGWSRAPIVESGASVWSLSDPVFQRLTASREPFWAVLDREDETFRVYLQSDRGEIFALGYPIITWFGQVINIAELALLVVVLYGALLVGITAVSGLTGRMPVTGRALLREVRSSFYRKLFLAYVAGTVLPVVILAFAIRTYFATQLRAGELEAAQRTVTTARRLVEDYATIQQAGTTALGPVDDQIMVLVRRAIDEDVNLFDRGRLQATSARGLFASLLLSQRTPGEVYRAIALDRAPTYVGDEIIGDATYRLAAAPVRAGGREGIVTVPLTNRQQEIDQQIDELDRRVRSLAVLFSVLGAGLGYWMAERIADPVSRLTRATRRIARGDLDARVAAASSDELGRLVEDFNQMAADLKRQRVDLERTQRLEAWADMARQVAHDIKNPLTPIQLSAEHARRVNIDRGRPLSPVLDDCVNAILNQVKLLRQISAEFSSFASSPTPKPEATPVAALIEEVVEPYRTGLIGRIAIDVKPPDGELVAMIDRTLFARALTNIIENALHAMPGTGRLTITSHQSPSTRPATSHEPPATSPHARAVVEISDTGVGMDDEALNRIFEPYFSTKATGTGLGLTIAKRNVELNGGAIDVRSERGKGTTVTMTLPLAE